MDHLLLHCPISRELWSMPFGLFGVCWVMPSSVLGLLDFWQGPFGRHRNSAVWQAVPPCLMWCLRWECNAHSFEDCERTIELKLLFFRTLFDWVSLRGSVSCSSMLYFFGFTLFTSLIILYSLYTLEFRYL